VIRFQNTAPSDRITATPRALFRVVVERVPTAWLSYATGALSWREQVQKIIDNGSNPAAYPLGGAVEAVLDTDRVATLDYVAKSTAGSNVTVADLVNAIEAASQYARVVSVARVGVVPATSEGGVDKLAADRETTTQTERERAAEGGIAGALKSVRSVLILAVIVAAGVAAYRLFPTKASTK
jgi:hypothetical protein